MNRLVEWSEDWQMKFNFSKCRIMHTGVVKHEMNVFIKWGDRYWTKLQKKRI